MAQKVISVNVLVNDTGNYGFKEHSFPQLQAAFDEGYYVKQVIPMAPSTSLYSINLTFVLDK